MGGCSPDIGDDEGEGGFSLIEVLIAVIIMGLGFVAILAAMGTAASSAGLHRTQAVAELEVRRYAELIQAAGYVDAGYTASGVGYTAPTTPPFAFTPAEPSMTCVDTAATTVPCAGAKVQIVTVSVHSDDLRVDESLQVVKRKSS
jgi:prepilin-type N-terminal cleavage/methylation domain-containing protein